MRPSLSLRPPVVLAAALVFAGLSPRDAAAQFVRTVVVSPRPTPLGSGLRLLRALARITTAGPGRPYLVKIEPGIYDLGTASLAMKPYVDVEGSGEGVTRVISSVDTTATIVGAANSALRHLTVENDGANQAIALRNDAAPFTASHVTCVATGGALGATGIANNSTDPAVTFEHVTARAGGADSAVGISSRGGLMRSVHARVSASDLAYAVFNSGSDGELVDVVAEAESGRFAGGIRNESGGPTLRNVRAFAKGADIGDGIVNGGATRARIFGAVIHAIGGPSFASGIRNEFATALISQADITAEADSSAFGVSCILGGRITLVDVTVRATSAGNGIGVLADDGTVTTIDRSSVGGDGFSVATGFGPTASRVDVGASRLEGPVRPGAGTINCVVSYDANLVHLDPACMP